MSISYHPDVGFISSAEREAAYSTATHANYNIRVKGDTTRSTVLVSVFWKELLGAYDCAAKGVWEAQVENEIKNKAESK